MQAVGRVKVTVLMTLYNKGEFVEEAVRSVLDQTFADFELLVVDDASTDEGPERVAAMGDARVRILSSAVNTGRANAANRGYDAARGDYVAVLDADDVMLPERLAEQVTFMDAHPEVVAVGSDLAAFGSGDRVYRTPPDDAAARALLPFGVPVLYPTCMVRRSLIDANAVRCRLDWRHPGMDHLFLLDAGATGLYASLPMVLTRYRTGSQNMRHGRDPIADGLVLHRAVLERLGYQPTDAELRCHLALVGLPVFPMDSRSVVDVKGWCNTLRAWNDRTQVLPREAFSRELERRFDVLFGPAADQGFGPGFQHVRSSGSWGRIPHLVRRTLLG